MSETQLSKGNAVSARPAPREFVITRTFEAALDRVWRAWTIRAELMRWFGPSGFTMPAAKMDFRIGGSFHYCLCAPDGNEMWGKFVYRDIVPQQRIVLVNSFSDSDGGITRHPFAPTWPLELLSTSEFQEANGVTTITLRWLPLNATDEEISTFDGAHDGCRQGWTGTFDQLAAYLSKAE